MPSFPFLLRLSLSLTHPLILLPWALMENGSTNSYYLLRTVPVPGSTPNALWTVLNIILKITLLKKHQYLYFINNKIRGINTSLVAKSQNQGVCSSGWLQNLFLLCCIVASSLYGLFINMGQYFKLKIYALGRAKYSAATVKHPTLAVIRDRKINERMPVHYRLSQSPTFG